VQEVHQLAGWTYQVPMPSISGTRWRWGCSRACRDADRFSVSKLMSMKKTFVRACWWMVAAALAAVGLIKWLSVTWYPV
jgi:hypothetical protein